jgi:ubiquinone/menaquinone biosynthesis C-methylase UbiE
MLYRLLKTFFYLLYQPFAWTYDLVAWVVSLGRWRTWIATVLHELSGPRVLELGHGPGHLQVAMRSKGLVPFGIDLSPQMSALAKHKLGTGTLLVRASGTHLPFATEAFDQLVATFPTEYIIQRNTLASAQRVLRPGGNLVLLPVAWLTGTSRLDRAFAWLFRVTGQAGEWTGAFTAALRSVDFETRERAIELAGSAVMLVIGTKRQPVQT